MRHSILMLVAGVAAVLLAIPTTVGAEAQSCRFTLGFAALHAVVPEFVGDCLEGERVEAASGNVLQRTTNGLLVWRRIDNWTAFTNGSITWVNGPYGVLERLNGERFLWEEPFITLYRPLAGFDGIALVPKEGLAPFADLTLTVAEQGPAPVIADTVPAYSVSFGDRHEEVGDSAGVRGFRSQRVFGDYLEGFLGCAVGAPHCAQDVSPNSRLEYFQGFTVNGLPARALHRLRGSQPVWQVAWHDPHVDMTYELWLSGDVAGPFGAEFGSHTHANARRVADLAGQLVRLR